MNLPVQVVTMSKKKGRGGARRNKVPEVDEEHLLDSLLSHARKLGGHAFVMGKYWKLETSQSVKGDSMADLLPLLQVLGSVCPSLEFKYSTLKNCYQEVLKQFPVIKEMFQVSEMAMLPQSLAECTLVLCNHARRIGRDDSKFAEACSKVTTFQVEKLEAVRQLVRMENKKAVLPTAGSAPKKKAKVPDPVSPAPSSVKTQDILEMDIPPTQEERSSSVDSLLAEARGAKPIPVRKALLKEEVKAFKRPGAGPLHRPAAANVKKNGNKKPEKLPDTFTLAKEQKLKLMPYNKLGSMALRIVNGRQLLQVKSPKGIDESMKLALHMKKMIEQGKNLGQVKAWKSQKLS